MCSMKLSTKSFFPLVWGRIAERDPASPSRLADIECLNSSQNGLFKPTLKG